MISRRFKAFIIAIVGLCSFPVFAEGPTEQHDSLRVACVGDSITFGSGIEDRDNNSYPSQLATWLGDMWEVKNFGVPSATLLKKGDKPYWGLPQYQAALEFQPDVVIIKLGTNDSKPENWKYKAEYVLNYIELIESFQQLESKPTVWICYPVPAYPGRWGITDQVIKEEVIPQIDEVARQANVKVINLYSALSDKKEMFPDQVHPNADGAKVMAETIAETLANDRPENVVVLCDDLVHGDPAGDCSRNPCRGKGDPKSCSFEMKGNPLVRHISSTDPDVHVWDGEVWIYCSQDHPKQPGDQGTYDRMDGYHAFSSKDLVYWTDHGEVIHSRDVAWGKEGWMWAPGAACKDGKYYLYYPHRDRDDAWRIGVAIGDTPAGPFRDIGHPIEGITGIDPCVFIDDDGEAYLYNNSAIVAKLKPNMIELAEEPRRIDYGPEEVRKDETLKFNEGAFMHKRNGIYYYSYTNWKNKEVQGFYAVGDNPYGPFEWKGPFAPRPANAQFHHSIIDFKGQAYCFYHMATPNEIRKKTGPSAEGFQRRIACFDCLYYNEDGTIRMVDYTTDWVPSGK